MENQRLLEVLIEELAQLRVFADAMAGAIQNKGMITREAWTELLDTCRAVNTEKYQDEIRQKVQDASREQ
ncbi:MAG: hypothetical protein R3B95_21690 [Nitrospirales bacterium]|nr:hypothetical protein [Nitrospirales bacterium]